MNHINLSRLNPYDLHKHLINEYILTKPGCSKLFQRDTSKDKNDFDVIKENHLFLWKENDSADSWEKQLAKKYYDKLFKEYCICDLTRYKDNKVALRWRIENEVVIGKGQFTCGNKSCTGKNELRSWEVNFAYVEHEVKKNALIKLRLCPDCSNKLNYRSKKREVKRNLKRIKKMKRSRKTDKHNNNNATEDTENYTKSNNESIGDTNISDNEDEEDDNQMSNDKNEDKLPENTWTKAAEIEDKSREEEFDEYLENLLL